MNRPAYKTEGVNRTKTMRFYPFVSTGKEKDEETGYGYFGARYMDHELMTMWLSVDRYASKYPFISPYAYCAWNPIMITDPTGDTLFALDADSQNDIRDIAETYGDRVVFDKRGVVSLDYSGMSDFEKEMMNNHDGIKLINDIMTTDQKILYESSVMARITNLEGEKSIYSLIGDINGVLNLSRGGLDSEGGYMAMPRTGYDGQVVINPYGYWTSKGEMVSRSEIVMHELAENYARTVLRCNFKPMKNGTDMQKTGAHEYANQRMKNPHTAYTFHRGIVPNWKRKYYEKKCNEYYGR